MTTLPLPFFFLRHGETDWNRAGLVMGLKDIPLNAEGRTQAAAAANILTEYGIASIWSSPLGRARETAEIVASRLGLAVSLIGGLAERNWGIYEGGAASARKNKDAAPEGGESAADFTRRSIAALSEVGGPAPALVVAHSGTFRALCRHMNWPHGAEPVANAQPLLVTEEGPHPLHNFAL
ncbi:histidine phosphatase family protein [Telmatospirillum sp. J64-1]|uniref:histidine phosphatase family protein n=1 Tax=Telmatospirillum sp. J64-1 TaxID=2502183 RepID=UPI00115D81F4|nr:histidine phosphatase family protein [Telmatospirillum sp. J64-1]